MSVNRRRINIRSDIGDIQDRHKQIKARLARSIHHHLGDARFETLSYTDAVLMLVETDITIMCRQRNELKLFKSDPDYYKTVWEHFALRFIPRELFDKLDDPRVAFATMLNAVTVLADVPAKELYEMLMDKNTMSYGGVRGAFQRVRVPGESRYERVLMFEEVTSLEHLYEGSLKLACVAIDAYISNYLAGWTSMSWGAPRSALATYIRERDVTKVFSFGDDEAAMYNNLDPLGAYGDNELLPLIGVDLSAGESQTVVSVYEIDSELTPQALSIIDTSMNTTAIIDATETQALTGVNPNRLLP